MKGIRKGTRVRATVPNDKLRYMEYAGRTILGEVTKENRCSYNVEFEVGPNEFCQALIKKDRVFVVCPICGEIDSARNPIMQISNANDSDPNRGVACRECVSKYDGLFAWDGDKIIYV